MAEDKLNLDERLKVLRMQRAAYRQANKAEKGRILGMLELLTGLNRTPSGMAEGPQDHHPSDEWLLYAPISTAPARSEVWS